MSLFWIIAVVLAVAAGALLARPLWRQRAADAPDVEQSNLAALRDQMRELDADLAAGVLSADQHAATRAEIERRVLSDVVDARSATARLSGSSRALAGMLLVCIPAAALGLYALLGNPGAIGAAKHGAADMASMTPEHFAQMTEKLAGKLKQDPSDLKGWLMLGKAYKVLNRLPEASAALEDGVQRAPQDAELLAEYAEVLALIQGGNFAGKPEQVVLRLLKAAPNHPKGLTMAGAAAFERRNYSGAISHWEKLLRLVKDDVELQKALLAGIAEASRLRTVAATPAQGISGRVQLDPSLADKVDPADTVFIFARGPDNTGMPLAARRHQARELPIAFRLDDTYAVNPQAKLGSVPAIVVGVRVSKSGDAMPKSGDLQVFSKPVKLGSSNVVLTIKDTVP